MWIKSIELIRGKRTEEDLIKIIGEYGEYEMTADQVQAFLIEDGQMCEHCEDSGEVSRMEAVYPGEPHMADIGTETCTCKRRDDDDYDRDS